MAGTPKMSAMDLVACVVPTLAAFLGIVLCLTGASVPAVVLAVLGLVLGITALAGREKMNLKKSTTQTGFVIGLAGFVFTVSYTVLTYVAFLAAQSF